MRTRSTSLWQRGLLLVGISSLVLIGCNRSDPATETEASTIEAAPSEATATADSTNTTIDSNAPTPPADDTSAISEETTTPAQPVPADTPSDDLGKADAPPETLIDAQITDMRYESATGERISVVFTTSPSGILSAQLTFPSQAPMTLDAPEGQGNNPTYRSNDGKVQLVSHAGGNRIDVIINDTVTSYEATSVDARVVTTS